MFAQISPLTNPNASAFRCYQSVQKVDQVFTLTAKSRLAADRQPIFHKIIQHADRVIIAVFAEESPVAHSYNDDG
jgi:hypothetical protein